MIYVGLGRCGSALSGSGVGRCERVRWDQMGRPVNQKYPVLYTVWSVMGGYTLS